MVPDTSTSLVHVDMDAFFASVEQRDDPSLRGLPVVVGHRHRGVVCAASYEARPYGIRSAMPMTEALRRCPRLMVRTPRFKEYQQISAQIFAIFARFTPQVQGLSLDEATLDVSHSQALFGPGPSIARAIRHAIATEVGLASSAGIARNKFLAKLMCEQAKPNGQKSLHPAEELSFLAPLSIEVLWGVGPSGAGRLRALGITTLGDLQTWSIPQLEAQLGPLGSHVGALARGIDNRPVLAQGPLKQVGSESTLAEDVCRPDLLRKAMLGHALKIAARLSEIPAFAHQVQLKLKTSDFKIITRETSLATPAYDADALYEAGKRLLDGYPGLGRVGFRLVGLSAKQLAPGRPPPLLLDPAKRSKHQAVEDARTRLSQKFGHGVLSRASLLDNPLEGT